MTEGLFMVSAIDMLSNLEQNTKWLNENYDVLQKEFDSEWVAVLNRTVIDHDHDLTKLVKWLRTKHSSVYNQIAVEYVSTEKVDLIL